MPDQKHSSSENKAYQRPSERMFRRSRAAEARRRASERKDAKFMRLVFGIAGFAALIAMMFFYMFAQTAQAAEAASEDGSKSMLTQPMLGNLTLIDMAGIAFVFIAGYAVWLRYKK